MNIVAGLFQTTLGKKFIMAVTGAALVIFVIGHLLGNLQVFLGPESINAYGHFLKSKPGLVWGARLGLLAMVGLHIWSAITLAQLNRAARPEEYTHKKPVAASYASRTMLMSGMIVAAFIVYHLAHYTALIPVINGTGQNFETFRTANGWHDVYRMMVVGFQQPIVSVFYIVAMALLCLHLSHGVGSAFQSIGFKNLRYRKTIDRAAEIFALAIFLGYVSIPISILLGIVK